MMVCICHGVTDRDILTAAASGICSMQGLEDELNVAASCGRCLDSVRQILYESVDCWTDSAQQISIAL